MTNFKNQSLKDYLDSLASHAPVPGGGSAAALSGALGAALISMVAHYSLGKGKPEPIEKQIKDILSSSQRLREQFLELVDLDAEAYLGVVNARKEGVNQEQAGQKARDISHKVCSLCQETIELAPFLVTDGNKYLLSDVEVAVELLSAAFNSSLALLKS